MSSLRQLAGGLLYAIVSVVLVIGSLSLALVEQSTPPSPTAAPTLAPSLVPAATLTLAASSAPATAAATIVIVRASPTSTPYYPAFQVQPPLARIPPHFCGPFPGWVRGYIVQPGDTLFRIAVIYGTTVTRLEIANCRTSSYIFAGERLWVPYVLNIAPGITTIPIFDTPTDIPTEALPPPADTLTPTPTATDSGTQDP